MTDAGEEQALRLFAFSACCLAWLSLRISVPA